MSPASPPRELKQKGFESHKKQGDKWKFLPSSSLGLGAASTHSPHCSLTGHLDWSGIPSCRYTCSNPLPCSQHSLIPCLKVTAHTDHLPGVVFFSPTESSSALRPN